MSFERMRARADRVKTECDLGELLQNYGYTVVPDKQREQQFQCDLHGLDNKPSARFYGHNNTSFCWVCQKTRDPISYVMEKELVNFREAIEFLEKKLGLAALPWSDEGDRPVEVENEIEKIEKGHIAVTYEKAKATLHRFLTLETQDRFSPGSLDMRSLLSFWEVFDRVDYGVARENWSDAKGAAGMVALHERALKKTKEFG